MKHVWSQAGILLVLASVPAAVTATLRDSFPHRSLQVTTSVDIDVAAAGHLVDALWVDARPPRVFAMGHVPDAINVPDEVDDATFSAFASEWNPSRPVVVYCDGGECEASIHVADTLRHATNASQIYVLRGGWPAWLASPSP